MGCHGVSAQLVSLFLLLLLSGLCPSLNFIGKIGGQLLGEITDRKAVASGSTASSNSFFALPIQASTWAELCLQAAKSPAFTRNLASVGHPNPNKG